MKGKGWEENFRAFPQFQICHYTTGQNRTNEQEALYMHRNKLRPNTSNTPLICVTRKT